VVVAPPAVTPLVSDGLTNREVADRLFVSLHVHNSHLRPVRARLSLRAAHTAIAGRIDPGRDHEPDDIADFPWRHHTERAASRSGSASSARDPPAPVQALIAKSA